MSTTNVYLQFVSISCWILVYFVLTFFKNPSLAINTFSSFWHSPFHPQSCYLVKSFKGYLINWLLVHDELLKPLLADRLLIIHTHHVLLFSQESICVRVSFSIKLQTEASNFIKKETLAHVFPYEFCVISKNTFSLMSNSTSFRKTLLPCGKS